MDEMSEKIGISKSFYEKIESGTRQPSYNFIMKFKEVFPSADVNCILNPTQSV
ncbi:MAG: helix-turn-helix transcriptional regulator [Ruminococcaceae bacterium]|nr:helix-turn-helix transcriptional regulator [Oscillospiraceae bacterium]